MRTKAEIKGKIAKIREGRDSEVISVPEWRNHYRQACNLIIMGMQYALGYKTRTFYWCGRCAIYHSKVKCPKCGNDTLKSE